MRRTKFRKISTMILSAILSLSMTIPAYADVLEVMEDQILPEPDIITPETLISEDQEVVSLDVDITNEDTEINNESISEPGPVVQHEIKDDPGIIWMPVEDDIPFEFNEDEFSPDGISQLSGVTYAWPDLRLDDEHRGYVIKRCKEIVNEVLDDSMSDIEKYFRLMVWIDQNIEYPDTKGEWYLENKSDHEKTPHGSHGALKYGYGVCQGKTLLYSHLCHAADLPCDEIAQLPQFNHIVNFIPNINGHSYYIDPTNFDFLFSDTTPMGFDRIEKRNMLYGEYMDKHGKDIVCDDNSFCGKGYQIQQFMTWDYIYEKFIKNPNPRALSVYEEKGSGVPGIHYAHYADWALRDDRNTGNWELDDFFNYPKNQLDKKNIADIRADFVKDTFKFDTEAEYLNALRSNLILTDTQIQGEKRLKLDVDYTLGIEYINETVGCVRATGIGDYTGCCLILFKIDKNNSPEETKPIEKTLDIVVVKDKYIQRRDIIDSFDNVKYSCNDTTIANITTLKDENGYIVSIHGNKAGFTTATIETKTTIYKLNITVKEPELEKQDKNITLIEGESEKIVYVNSNNDYTYSVKDDSVAKILTGTKDKNGFPVEIKGLKEGSTTATITTKNTVFTVSVAVKSIPKDEKNYLIVTGGKITDASFAKIPSDGRNYKIDYSNKNIVSVSDKGIIQGKNAGSSVVTITRSARITTLNVTVINPGFDKKSYVKNTGDVFSTGFDAQGLEVKYSSSNTKVATVDEHGDITAIAKGSANINAVVQGKKCSVGVKVFDPVIMGQDTVLLNNKTITLSVKNGNGKTVWSVDDENVATIKNGKVKGISKGIVTVTAINNGRTMTKTVSVYNVPKFEKKSYETNVGDRIEVILTKDSDMGEAVYSVSNAKLATIDSDGTITPIKKGTVTVTAEIGGKKYKTKVKIK